MKYTKQTLILLLILLFVFTGCQQAPVETTAATEPPTTAPTEPPASQIYAQAADALSKTQNILLRVSTEQTVEVSGQTYTTQSSQTITYLNYGTDRLRASIKENVSFCDHNSAFSELYADGKVYTTASDAHFVTELEDVDYTALYTPVVLLDETLYGSVTQDGSQFTFSQPTALEEWMSPETAQLLEAEGTATLDASGKLSGGTYHAVYQYGPSKITESYKVTIGIPNTTEIAIPEDTSSYIPCDSIGAMWLYDRAYGYLLASPQVSSQILEQIVSQAAGFVMNRQYYLDAQPHEQGAMYRVKQSINQNSAGKSDEFEREEIFRGGELTTVEDGGKPKKDSTISEKRVHSYVYELLSDWFLKEDTFAEITCTDTGTLYLLEITANEDFADDLRAQLCYDLFQNVLFLDDLASAYETTKLEFYCSIDKYIGTPVAVGMLFEVVHTIDGQEYILSQQIDQSYEIPSNSAYHNITEEYLPEAEPSDKATPLFYHVTGTGGQEMWLFGTIHVGDERTAFLPQEIYDALDGSDALAIECDTDGFDEKLENDSLLQSMVSAAYYYQGATVDKFLDTPELYDHAKQLMKATGNYFYNSEYMKAYLWGNSIDNYYMDQGRQLTSQQGVEERLTKRAEEKEIPLREVESVIFQIQMMGGYSKHLQEFLLYNAVASNGQESWENTMELYEMWCSGDEAALIEYLTDDEPWILKEEDFDTEDLTEEELAEVNDILSRLDEINAELTKIEEEYNSSMSTNRNKGMLEVAKEYLESGDVVFYAVGLAHLLAEDGLVNTLRDAGYTVELVAYA